MTISVVNKKVVTIADFCSTLLSRKNCTICDLTKVISNLEATSMAISFSPLYYKKFSGLVNWKRAEAVSWPEFNWGMKISVFAVVGIYYQTEMYYY